MPPAPAEPLRFTDPGGARLEVVVRVERDGAWTPGPFASIDAGNQVEFTLAELEWLVRDAGPVAIDALRALHEGVTDFQAGGHPRDLSPAVSPITDERPPDPGRSSTAGQGETSDPRPRPADSSSNDGQEA